MECKSVKEETEFSSVTKHTYMAPGEVRLLSTTQPTFLISSAICTPGLVNRKTTQETRKASEENPILSYG